MDYTTLDELMKITKKGEASKANKKLFVEEMYQMLDEEGITEKSISYLRAGFGFAAAKPLAVYIQKSSQEKRKEIIEKVLSSELIKGTDRVASFKFAVNLSAYSIMWLGDEQKLLVELIKVLPDLSRNKEKQMLKDAPKIYEKYFLGLVSADTSYPSIDPAEAGIRDYFLREYRKMMKLILEKVSGEYKAKVDGIYNWLGVSGPVTEDKSQNVKVTGESGNNTTLEIMEANDEKAEEKKQTREPYSSKELDLLISAVQVFSERMKDTVESWKSGEKERVKADRQNLELKMSIADLQSQMESIQKRNVSLSEELTLSKSEVLSARGRIKETERTIAERDAHITELQEEITRLNAIISVYSADKQNSQSEQLNAIASKLKSEYRDFMDVENEEMTVDLGENFRFQLQSVFKILIKAGIDVERR